MPILFGLLISPGFLQSGESTLWVSYTGHQVLLDICSSTFTRHQMDGSNASNEYNPGGSNQVPAEHYI
jgi:hypothetical protein